MAECECWVTRSGSEWARWVSGGLGTAVEGAVANSSSSRIGVGSSVAFGELGIAIVGVVGVLLGTEDAKGMSVL